MIQQLHRMKLYVIDIVSTNVANAIPTKMINTIQTKMSTNSDGKKVRYKMVF